MKTFLITLLLTPFAIFLRAYTFAKLWLWFVVPTFSVPIISLPIAYGIATLVYFTTFQSNAVDKEASQDDNFFITQSLAAIILPLATLLTGYIATLFI